MSVYRDHAFSDDLYAAFAEFEERQPPSDPATPERKLPEGVTIDDFRSYMPMHRYIFAPSRDLWPAASVNACVPPVLLFDDAGEPVLDDAGKQVKVKAAAWLDRHRAVETMTWAPGQPMILHATPGASDTG
jgi:hypothetical protein